MNQNAYVGVVDHPSPHKAYVFCEELQQEVPVRGQRLNGAWHGDTVEVSFQTHLRKKVKGRVLRVLKRRKELFVGIFQSSEKNYGFVVVDERRVYTDIFVYRDSFLGSKNGDKVLVRVKDWHSGRGPSPVGVVVENLGPAGGHETEIRGIMLSHDVSATFPDEVLKESDAMPNKIGPKDLARRRDMRDVSTFTIDPEDAKDFDDALSYRVLDKDTVEVGIHIADVTHYVKPDTALEKEALRRATSIYLVDRTLPMLPEKLSNKLCSLVPGEDRLTFSALFEVAPSSGKILKQWFGKAVIHSQRRFRYEEAQHCLEGKEEPLGQEIRALWEIAKRWQKERFAGGSIDFDNPEVTFELDKDFKPLRIVPKARLDAHRLVEECMLMANRKVAEFAFGKGRKDSKSFFVYRIHEDPDQEKLETLKIYANKFGHPFSFRNSVSSALNKLLKAVQNRPEAYALSTLAIRCMPKAYYTLRQDKHFGLGYEHYTHFTSPIRRYPDMMVHRLLQGLLEQKRVVGEKSIWEKACLHSSEMEKQAAEAERASVKYKQVEWMQDHIGETFEGFVSGVRDWGIFVEITSMFCEGMVKKTSLKDDVYDYDEKSLSLRGRRRNKVIALGDLRKIRVIAADLQQRTLDFEFLDDDPVQVSRREHARSKHKGSGHPRTRESRAKMGQGRKR